ncbi:MAG: amino acid adenylation domain-containing protein [Pseudomonadota bacterium]|nr:amino acid adenylation domain-containing protein [Pseudomonadota bacterium]
MNAINLLAKARAAGVRISPNGNQLKLRASKGAIKKELIEEIKANKEELLILLSKTINNSKVIIPKVDRSKALAPSFAQQRLWFLDELDPESSIYNISYRLGLEGKLDKERLQDALDQIIVRHESLRTVFRRQGDKLTQVILSSMPCPIEHIKTEDVSAHKNDLEKNFITQKLNLTDGPLIRAGLIELSSNTYQLLICVHHIIFDVWSGQLFFEQLSDFYFKKNDDELTKLPIQFADYAAWQADTLNQKERERLLKYWRKEMNGAPPSLELPFDFKRPIEPNYSGAWRAKRLSNKLLTRLNSLAAKEGSTLFMLMFSAFAILLFRYTRETDIVIGTSIDGRNNSDLEGVIGFFLNTIEIRCKLDGNPSFINLLARIKESLLGGFEHQELPFEVLVDDLQPERELSRTPLLQVMLDWQQEGEGNIKIPGLNVTGPDFISQESSKFDLTLTVLIKGDELEIGFEYSTELFNDKTIIHLTDSLECLLENITEDPKKSIDKLNVTNNSDKEWLLNKINKTDKLLEKICLHELIEKRSEIEPNSIALEWENRKLSYKEINSHANSLARALIDQGLGPGKTACVLVDRGLDFPLILLAVLKVGAAYVPIAPDIPKERLTYMLENVSASLIITNDKNLDIIDSSKANIFLINDFNYESGDGRNLKLKIQPKDAAYVIYTSGSTGRPKGVTLSHEGLVNLVKWQAKQPGLETARRTIHYASLSFDVSFTEIFTTWDAGGTLVIIEENLRRDFQGLIEFINSEKIERVFLPCAALDPFCRAVNLQTENPPFTDVIVSGEQLQITPSIRKMFEGLPSVRLHNHYGPAETHVVTALTLSGDAKNWETLPSIGSPIDNSRLYILDKNMELMPRGAAGELYIGGTCVGLGYHGNPQQTKERFITNPFHPEVGSKIYKTGDLVRYRADNKLDFLGRIDAQIKLRGYRIEPGEIETVLTENDSVQTAAVILRGKQINKSLVAYIVSAEKKRFSSEKLRDWAKRFLPDYMIPNLFIEIDSMPITPTGKLDKLKLPEPDQTYKTQYVKPETETENKLTEIYADLLDIQEVGVNDDFFRIGGNSLLAMQLVAKIRSNFNFNLPLKHAFRYSEPRSLAALIDAILLGEENLNSDKIEDKEQFIL